MIYLLGLIWVGVHFDVHANVRALTSIFATLTCESVVTSSDVKVLSYFPTISTDDGDYTPQPSQYHYQKLNKYAPYESPNFD